MNNDIKVTWEIDDGYVGNRPQTLYIARDDWEDCETQEDKERLIDSYIEDEIRNNIGWYIKQIEE